MSAIITVSTDRQLLNFNVPHFQQLTLAFKGLRIDCDSIEFGHPL